MTIKELGRNANSPTSYPVLQALLQSQSDFLKNGIGRIDETIKRKRQAALALTHRNAHHSATNSP